MEFVPLASCCTQRAIPFPPASIPTAGPPTLPVVSVSRICGVPQPEAGTKRFVTMLNNVPSDWSQTAIALPAASAATCAAKAVPASASISWAVPQPVAATNRLDQMSSETEFDSSQTTIASPPGVTATSGVSAKVVLEPPICCGVPQPEEGTNRLAQIVVLVKVVSACSQTAIALPAPSIPTEGLKSNAANGSIATGALQPVAA